MNATIIIPARKGSKGLPKKNQILLDYTLSEIPLQYHEKVIVSTDDSFIINKVENNYSKCRIHHRSEESARDSASTKECILEVVRDFNLTDNIIMLYLTYPERKWDDVKKAYEWFKKQDAGSLLCREETFTHPFLCLYDIGDNKGRQITPHDLYRRQDYPLCFKTCHMISIFKTLELKNLNKNLYNENTIYYKTLEVVDVDTFDDLRRFKIKNVN